MLDDDECTFVLEGYADLFEEKVRWFSDHLEIALGLSALNVSDRYIP